MRFAILGMHHETNTFAVEKNDSIDIPIQLGEDVLRKAHPRSYVGGFAEIAHGAGAELVPIGRVDFTYALRGGLITAPVYKHFEDLLLDRLRQAGPVDGVYFALHGAMDVEAPYQDAEGCLIRAARELLGPALPFVATYDFHSNYAPGECEMAVPFPYNTNPHVDGYERGREAAECLLRMVQGEINPVTHIVHVPIIGPNIGQSTWSHIPEEEAQLPLYRLNQVRAEMEQEPGVINITIQGGYGYSDLPYTGMSIIATTDNQPALAEKLAQDLARQLWALREEIRTVRPILPIDDGVRAAMEFADTHDEGLVCLVDIGDDPGSLCPADSPAVLESLLRLGARDCALTIRDANVVAAGMAAGVGATLEIEVGASIDQRFYRPIPIRGTVKSIDDGRYKIVGPTHGGWSREVTKEAFRDVDVGTRIVLRMGDKIDVIFSNHRTGKDRDFFKSAGIVLEEKRIIVVKSNQAHRASFDPIVARTIELDTPGVSTANYARLPFQHIPRPIYPLDMEMAWEI